MVTPCGYSHPPEVGGAARGLKRARRILKPRRLGKPAGVNTRYQFNDLARSAYRICPISGKTVTLPDGTVTHSTPRLVITSFTSGMRNEPSYCAVVEAQPLLVVAAA